MGRNTPFILIFRMKQTLSEEQKKFILFNDIIYLIDYCPMNTIMVRGLRICNGKIKKL
jgi:hypothetical protein